MKKYFVFLFCLLFVLALQAQTTTISIIVGSSSDDAEERQDGTSVSLTSTDLELVNDGSSIGNQTVGIRFANVNIPAEAVVLNAYIQFTADGSTTEATSLIVKAEKTANAATFENQANNISSRLQTNSLVEWNNIVDWVSGQASAAQRTPDLSVLIQEILAEPDWQAGNAMSFIITGTGKRRAFAFDGNAANAPVLVIVLQSDIVINDDLAITSVLSPSSLIMANPVQPMGVIITNNGVLPQSNFNVSYSINGGAPVVEAIAEVLEANESIQFSFEQLADFSVAGDYSILFEVSLEGDEVPENNSWLTNIVVANFTTLVLSSSDDAEERENGSSVSLNSSDLELVNDGSSIGNQIVGIRFANVLVPADATINFAYIQFTADGPTNDPTSLLVRGEKVANASTYANTPFNVSSRSFTDAQVLWPDVEVWAGGQAGIIQRTPDLSAVVTEILSTNGWQTGHSLSFIITGTGKRRAYAFDGDSEKAPRLVIGFTQNTFIYNDLAVTGVLSPASTIAANEQVEIKIEITNFGENVQDDFQVSYSINGAEPIYETVSQSGSFGQAVEYAFQQKADLSQAGTYEILVSVHLEGDENPSNNSVLHNVSVIALNEGLFFSQGSAWKYLDNGSDQGTAWQEYSFDDSSWSVGVGHKGFGDGDETTLLTPGFITYYFRKKVHIPSLDELDEIYFHIVHDDGALLHINGVEAVRSSLMPEGPINYLTGTTTFIPNDLENEFWVYQVDKSYFVEGDNILAIEVHNQNTSSSDVSFDCFVTDSYVQVYKLDGPYVFYREGNIIVKTIEESGPMTYVYSNPEEVNLVCRFSGGVDSFMVALKPQLTIEPSSYELPGKFLAFSDIEGEIEAFVMLLRDAGVMNETYDWIFGDGHLFFVGDMFDRGTNVTECLWLLYRLESQAEAVGGKIHFIMGNHDIMNLIYDFRYVAQKYIQNAELMEETLESIYATDTELGRWLRTKNLIEQSGPFTFVHAGLSPGVTGLNLSLDEINYWGRYRMDNPCQSSVCSTINGGTSVGVYWYRGMARQELSQQQVDGILQAFNTERVVIGHTVFETITLLYNGKVICIDLKHEQNYLNGFMEAMYYEDGKIYRFYTNGQEQTYTLLDVITSIENDVLPVQGASLRIFPNPASSQFTISYYVSQSQGFEKHSSSVEISIYDNKGTRHAHWIEKNPAFGENQFNFDAAGLPSGVYYCQLKTSQDVVSKRVVLMK